MTSSVQSNRPYAIVTGASRGIGAAIAKALARDGYDVIVNYTVDQAAALATADQIIKLGARAIPIRADMGREEEILQMFATADREFASLSVLVNNAAITSEVARISDVTSAAISRMLAINIAGPILCAREAVRRMSTNSGGSGGAIVNISSLAARTGAAGEWVPYAASKGAINSLTIGLAREVAKEGIRVNAVAPGPIETDLHRNSGVPDRLDRLTSIVPMRRPGKPDEVAEAVRWLVSPAASFVTASIVEVGGGL